MIIESLHNVPHRLRREDTFRFACHNELPCFTSCCSKKDLVLSPYDVLRMKNRIGIDSDSFLARYTLFRIDPASGFPVISLRMQDGEEQTCPFVQPQGCSIYEDRPTACRLYPLGRATTRPSCESKTEEEFFFFLDAPTCHGLTQDREITIEQWIHSQELVTYLEMSSRMLRLLWHARKKNRTPRLEKRQIQHIIVACYNLDVFCEFILGSRFLDALRPQTELRAKIADDDCELLKIGFLYLEHVLFV